MSKEVSQLVAQAKRTVRELSHTDFVVIKKQDLADLLDTTAATAFAAGAASERLKNLPGVLKSKRERRSVYADNNENL